MKRTILENSCHAVSLQNRLSKYKFLSKDVIPKAADAIIFDLIQSSKRIEQNIKERLKKVSIQIYIVGMQLLNNLPILLDANDDQIIQNIQNFYSEKKNRKNSSFYPQNRILTPSLLQSSIRTDKRCSQLRKQRSQILLYVLNICFKQDITRRILEIITDLEYISIQIEDYELITDNNIMIIFASTESICQKLKDYISTWKTIEIFCIKQKKKFIQRSKTFENKMLKDGNFKTQNQNSTKI